MGDKEEKGVKKSQKMGGIIYGQPLNFFHYVLCSAHLPRVYFARNFIFSTVPTKYFAHIPANFFEFNVFVFELWIQLCYLKREDIFLTIPFWDSALDIKIIQIITKIQIIWRQYGQNTLFRPQKI